MSLFPDQTGAKELAELGALIAASTLFGLCLLLASMGAHA